MSEMVKHQLKSNDLRFGEDQQRGRKVIQKPRQQHRELNQLRTLRQAYGDGKITMEFLDFWE